METVTVTAAQLETFAFESGREIEIGPASASLRIGRKVFVAPLPIVVPAQRVGGES